MENKPLILRLEEEVMQHESLVRKINDYDIANDFLDKLNKSAEALYFDFDADLEIVGKAFKDRLNFDLYPFLRNVHELIMDAQSKYAHLAVQTDEKINELANEIIQEKYVFFKDLVKDSSYQDNVVLNEAINSDKTVYNQTKEVEHKMISNNVPFVAFKDLSQLVELERLSPDDTAMYEEVFRQELYDQAKTLDSMIGVYKKENK